jgi:hypothetical protein
MLPKGSSGPDPELAENLRNASEHPARLPLRVKVITLLIWLFAVYGFISFIAAFFSGAHAGTCHYYSDGPDAVTVCEDGSVIVRHRNGRVNRYGTPNAGFERYPGQPRRPVFERRED